MKVLLAPAATASECVLERLTEWSAAGLLRPFCWWAADEGADRSPRTLVRVADGERSDVTADAVLDASEDWALVAVVVSDAEQSMSVADFEASVGARLEVAASIRPFRPGEPTTASLIVIPGEIGEPVDPAFFSPEYNANIYVAPEDRADAQAANALWGNRDRLPAHAAHALCVLADLWARPADSEGSVLAQLGELERGPDLTDVSVVRCYSRAIDFGYLASHLAAAVFRAGDGWPNPDPERFDRRQDIQGLVEHVVKRFLAKHRQALGLSEPDLIPLPEPRELTLWQAIKELFTQLLFRLRNKPVEIIQNAIYEAYNRAADRVERAAGPDRDWRIKRPDRDNATIDDLAELADAMQKPTIVPDGPVEGAWRDLRLLTLGLVDGSDLPGGLDREILDQNNKRSVITRPAAVVPDPVRRPPASNALPDPRACDPLHLDPRFAPPPIPIQDGDEPDAEEEPPPLDRESWSEGRVGTPVWEIGAGIASAITEALNSEQVSLPSAEERRAEQERLAAEERDDRRRDRRRAWRSFVILTALALGGGAAAWKELSWAPLIAVLAGIAALWLVALGHVARRILRRRDHAEFAALRREVEALNAVIMRSARAGDRIRLERRYMEYLDWAEILGWFAHHPWVGEPLRHIPVQAPVDPESLPAALRVANARTRERLPVLGRQAQRKIFGRGWLSGLYDAIETTAMFNLAELRGFGRGVSASNRPNPAADLDQDPEGPRTYLREEVRSGRGRHLSQNPLSVKLLRVLDGVPAEAATDGVTLVDGSPQADDADSPPLSPSLAWFSEPEGLPELAARLRPSVVRICAVGDAGESWGGSGVVVGDRGMIATARHVIEGADQISVEFLDGATTQATVLRLAPHTDLGLLTVEGGSPAGVTLASAGMLAQGDPVISLGHPMLQEGEPTLAWGLVTATERRIRLKDPPAGVGRFDAIQATYTDAAGASGSPVFDLNGALVGIHVAGTDEPGAGVPDYLASAVPVAELHSLIDNAGTPIPASPAEAEPPPPGSARSADFSAVRSFLDELSGGSSDLAMLHQHWKDPSREHHRVRTVLRTGAKDDGDTTLAELAGPSEFYRPLQALASRIEVAEQSQPQTLVSCVETRPLDPTPANDGGDFDELG